MLSCVLHGSLSKVVAPPATSHLQRPTAYLPPLRTRKDLAMACNHTFMQMVLYGFRPWCLKGRSTAEEHQSQVVAIL